MLLRMGGRVEGHCEVVLVRIMMFADLLGVAAYVKNTLTSPQPGSGVMS